MLNTAIEFVWIVCAPGPPTSYVKRMPVEVSANFEHCQKQHLTVNMLSNTIQIMALLYSADRIHFLGGIKCMALRSYSLECDYHRVARFQIVVHLKKI